jgi:uncharacterized protein YecE (DUF72 family)
LVAGDIRIGCSGWSYPHWRKRFYPEKLPAREHFDFYARHFNTVELNNSFYRQPPRERFLAWREQAPPGFLFAVKGSRYISHIRRLAVEQKSVDLVVDSARGLGDKLGPVLFQFQNTFKLDLPRLERFLPMLPADVRFTLEFRHDSWLIESVFELLRAHRIALCIPDHPKMPRSFETTGDFTYIRMHLPPRGLGYGKQALQPWAERIVDWSRRGLDVFVYFNNDMEGHAINDAQILISRVGGI